MGTTLRKTPLLWVTLWLVAMALGVMALVATAGPAKAADPDVTPTPKPGNPTCKDLFKPEPAFEIKIDPPKSGTYGPITVTFHDDGTLVDFTSTVPVLAVFVKGGNEGGNFYDYRPDGSLGDNNLRVPTGQQISHVSFCWNEEPPPPTDALKVTKTAEATYDRTITWDLTKTVTPKNNFTGLAGDPPFSYTWNVDATKTEKEGPYQVTGNIKITNPNDVDVGVSVDDTLDDGTVATVTCPSNTVPANGSLECSYTSSPPNREATQNNVLVTSDNPDIPGNSALAPLDWIAKVTGDESVTLGDTSPSDNPPINYSETISDSTPLTFDRTFTCPTDRASYDANRMYTKTITNTATLTRLNESTPFLTRTAEVKFTCKYPWVGETATGAGQPWPGSNWFKYTPYEPDPTKKLDLIAGQNYDAGDIYFSRSGGNTYIKITLHNGFRWANVSQNLKIHPLDKAPTKFLPPGSFLYKFTVPQSTVTYTATIPGTTTKFYGIHADVERFVN